MTNHSQDESNLTHSAKLYRAYRGAYAIGFVNLFSGVALFLLAGMYFEMAVSAMALVGFGILYLLLGRLIKQRSRSAVVVIALSIPNTAFILITIAAVGFPICLFIFIVTLLRIAPSLRMFAAR